MQLERWKFILWGLSLLSVMLWIGKGQVAFAQTEVPAATASDQPSEQTVEVTQVHPTTTSNQPSEQTVTATQVPPAAAASPQPSGQIITVRMYQKSPEEIEATTRRLCATEPNLTPLGVFGIGAAAQAMMLYYSAFILFPALSSDSKGKVLASSAVLLTVGSTGGSLLNWTVFRKTRCCTVGWLPMFAGAMGGSAISFGLITMGVNGMYDSMGGWWLTFLSTMALPAAGQMIAYLIARKSRFADTEPGTLTSRGTIKVNDRVEYALPGVAMFSTPEGKATAGLSFGRLVF